MTITDTSHLYEIGMISTLFSLNENEIQAKEIIANGANIGQEYKVKTRLCPTSIVKPRNGMGVYPINIALMHCDAHIISYSGTIKLPVNVVLNFGFPQDGFTEKLIAFEKSRPNIERCIAYFLQYKKVITKEISDQLSLYAHQYNETLDSLIRAEKHSLVFSAKKGEN